MKRFFAVLSAAVVLSPVLALAAPDPLTVAPDMYKLLFENEKVRVMQVEFKPGQKIGKHTHPNEHFVTVLTPGTLTIYKDDGTSNASEFQANQVVWIPAETHWAENTGKTQVKLLVTEMKNTHTHK